MKKFFSLFIFCASTAVGYGQMVVDVVRSPGGGSGSLISDMAVAAAKYRFTHIQDTTKPSDPYTETMILLIGKQYSAYQSYDRMLRDSIMNKQMQEQVRSGSTNISISAAGMKPVSRAVIYRELATGKPSRLESLAGNYLIEDPLPEINWSIQPETKDFNGLQCQKATARFKGRNYTAWFCSQLPYMNGPWKLTGLPGLILEAYDDKKEVVFAFESFEDVSAKEMKIVTPFNTTKATQADFNQLQEAFKKDPQGFMRTQMAAAGLGAGNTASGMTIRSITINGTGGGGTVSATNPVKREINNPIEKPEQ